MKVSTVIQELKKLNPDEEIVVSWFDKQTYQDYYNDEIEITPAQWEYVVKFISDNDYYWQQINWTLEEAVATVKEKITV
jgi:predicted HNH restriction endonuclease